MKLQKILFISPNPAYDTVPTGGGKTFNFYLKNFSLSPKVEVRLLAVGRKNNLDFIKMEKQYNDKLIYNYKIRPIIPSLIRIIYYKSGMKYFLALFNAKFSQLDFVSKRYFELGAKAIKSEGWYPDTIILEWPEMLCIFPSLKNIFPKAKIMISAHDVAYNRYKRKIRHTPILGTLTRRIFINLKNFEISTLKSIDYIIAHSGKERNLLIDEGIDSTKILRIAPYFDTYKLMTSVSRNGILFWGAMNRKENLEAANWFIKNVFNHIKDEIPDIKFYIVGAARKTIIESFNRNDGVIATGFTYEPAEYFSKCFCMVAPLVNGAGIKIKVLEGMVSGLVVLTGSVGIEGIEATNKIHYYHCENPSDYRSTLNQLAKNRNLCSKVGEMAAQHVKSYFDFKNSFDEYLALILDK